MRKVGLALAMVASTYAPLSHALGLGNVRVLSGLNQPLIAEIPLSQVTSDELAQLKVGLALDKVFEQAGIESEEAVRSLKFQVIQQKNGSSHVRITTLNAVREPLLRFFLEASSEKGSVTKEYNLLLDPIPTSEAVVQVSQESGNATVSAMPVEDSATTTVPRTQGTSITKETIGPIQKRDTLWNLASKARPNRQITTEQMIIALKEANPKAFMYANVNGINRKSVLRIPPLQDIQRHSHREARALLDEDNAAWKAYRKAVSQGHMSAKQFWADYQAKSSSQPTGQEVSTTTDGMAATNSHEGTKEGAKSTESTSPSSVATTTVIAASQTAQTATESKSNVSSSEANPKQETPSKESEKTAPETAKTESTPNPIAMNGESITPPQKATPSQEGEKNPVNAMGSSSTTPTSGSTPDTKAEKPGDPPPSPSTMTGETTKNPSEPTSSEPEKKATEPQETMASSQQASTPQPTTENKESESGRHQAKPETSTSTTIEDTTKSGETIITPAGMDTAASMSPPSSEAQPSSEGTQTASDGRKYPDTIEIKAPEGPSIITIIIGVIALVATAVGGVFLTRFLKNRKKRTTRSPLFPVITFPWLRNKKAAKEESKEEDQYNDLINKIDMYIRVQRYKQAEELVRQSLAKQPDNQDFKMKLLEVYFLDRDTANFQKYSESWAGELKNTQYWETIVDMGQQMLPQHPLFVSHGTAQIPLTAPSLEKESHPSETATSQSPQIDFAKTTSIDLVNLSAQAAQNEEEEEEDLEALAKLASQAIDGQNDVDFEIDLKSPHVDSQEIYDLEEAEDLSIQPGLKGIDIDLSEEDFSSNRPTLSPVTNANSSAVGRTNEEEEEGISLDFSLDMPSSYSLPSASQKQEESIAIPGLNFDGDFGSLPSSEVKKQASDQEHYDLDLDLETEIHASSHASRQKTHELEEGVEGDLAKLSWDLDNDSPPNKISLDLDIEEESSPLFQPTELSHSIEKEGDITGIATSESIDLVLDLELPIDHLATSLENEENTNVALPKLPDLSGQTDEENPLSMASPALEDEVDILPSLPSLDTEETTQKGKSASELLVAMDLEAELPSLELGTQQGDTLSSSTLEEEDDLVDPHTNDMALKLDLARMYREMGDIEGANAHLQAVIAQGNESQKAQARQMLGEFSSEPHLE